MSLTGVFLVGTHHQTCIRIENVCGTLSDVSELSHAGTETSGAGVIWTERDTVLHSFAHSALCALACWCWKPSPRRWSVSPQAGNPHVILAAVRRLQCAVFKDVKHSVLCVERVDTFSKSHVVLVLNSSDSLQIRFI